jgi:hypothetical protein
MPYRSLTDAEKENLRRVMSDPVRRAHLSAKMVEEHKRRKRLRELGKLAVAQMSVIHVKEQES